MRFMYILAGTFCFLCLFNPWNTTLMAQQSASIEIKVTNHETELQNWRPYADTYLTFNIEVTVPTDFEGGKLAAALQNVTSYPGISGNVSSTIVCLTEEVLDFWEDVGIDVDECKTEPPSTDQSLDLLILKTEDQNTSWIKTESTLTHTLSAYNSETP